MDAIASSTSNETSPSLGGHSDGDGRSVTTGGDVYTTRRYDVHVDVDPSTAVPTTGMVYVPGPSVSDACPSNVQETRPPPASTHVPARPEPLLIATPHTLG